MKKRVFVIVVAILAVMMVFAACSTPVADTPAATPEAPATETPAQNENNDDGSTMTIGFNAGAMTNENMRLCVAGTKYEAEQEGVNFIMTESNFDPEQVMPNVNTLIMQGADMIIDFNVNAEVGGNIVDVAKENGLAGVIGCDVEYYSSNGVDRAWFMGANNQLAGELQGQAIFDYVNENKDGVLEKMVLVFSSDNGDAVKPRMGGAVDKLRELGMDIPDSDIEWIDLAGAGGSGAEGTEATREKFMGWLTANPNVHSVGVVCVNGEGAQGALAAAETVGRVEDIILSNSNVQAQYVQHVENGGAKQWIGCVSFNFEDYGKYLVPLAIDMITGANTDPSVPILIEHSFVKYDDLASYQQTRDAFIEVLSDYY